MTPVRPPSALTSAISWRAEGIKYRKNEVFLDVIESINLLVSSTGTILRSEVLGQVRVKSHLSGMPELRLGLNDKILFDATTAGGGGGSGGSSGSARSGKAVELEDVRFHQCVRLNKFESDRTISFIPPDGEFELMTYRVSLGAASLSGGGRMNEQQQQYQQQSSSDPSSSSDRQPPPIWVTCTIERWSASRVEYVLKVRIYHIHIYIYVYECECDHNDLDMFA